MKKLITSLLLLVPFCAQADAQIFLSDAQISVSGIGGDQTMFLGDSIPDGEGLFAIGIKYLGDNQFQFSYSGIAQLYALFNTSAGEAITPEFVQSNTSLLSNDGVGPRTSTLSIQPSSNIDLAYWDDRNFNDIADIPDSYGWITISRDESSSLLRAVESVTSTGAGIRVGEFTQIPIPIDENWVETEILGWIQIEFLPYAYSLSLDAWLYMTEDSAENIDESTWVYIFKPRAN